MIEWEGVIGDCPRKRFGYTIQNNVFCNAIKNIGLLAIII
jgi:hypothetical protein